MKKLSELVDVIENNEEMVALKIKPNTDFDLKLNGLKGDEELIRVTKPDDKYTISIYHKDGKVINWEPGLLVTDSVHELIGKVEECLTDFNILARANMEDIKKNTEEWNQRKNQKNNQDVEKPFDWERFQNVQEAVTNAIHSGYLQLNENNDQQVWVYVKYENKEAWETMQILDLIGELYRNEDQFKQFQASVDEQQKSEETIPNEPMADEAGRIHVALNAHTTIDRGGTNANYSVNYWFKEIHSEETWSDAYKLAKTIVDEEKKYNVQELDDQSIIAIIMDAGSEAPFFSWEDIQEMKNKDKSKIEIKGHLNPNFKKLDQTVNIKVNGQKGTWYVCDRKEYNGELLYEVESEIYGDEAAHLIISADKEVLVDEAYDGFYSLDEEIKLGNVGIVNGKISRTNIEMEEEEEYEFEINEVLSKRVTVSALNAETAYEKVMAMYRNEEIVLTPEDYSDGDIKLIDDQGVAKEWELK